MAATPGGHDEMGQKASIAPSPRPVPNRPAVDQVLDNIEETLRGNGELISMLTFSGTPDGGMRLAGIIRRAFTLAEGFFTCGTGRHFSITCTVFI
jgi:hypothetical protein